ncbi:uncharacterized protein LOC62_04G005272 [Vanrija pseudolonga]|uniref:Uncharacterized protein n=1 Tax=Vanrija pseudolonga TaxID=143232 RepID=A0AAF0YC60_9TREE|nr:hypothetical protein LOC62_04G005272 [Vanrija pseudolonga]
MDSTAFPHILEKIIEEFYLASTLLALRATSRHCQALVDDRLFEHAVMRTEKYRPRPPKSKGLRGLLAVKLRKRARYTLSLPPSSPIRQDVPQLPLVPQLVQVLDLDGPFLIEGQTAYHVCEGYTSYMRGEVLPTLGWESASRLRKLHPLFPLILRRMGPFVAEEFRSVHCSAVDYVALGNADVNIRLPTSVDEYILHLQWAASGPDAPSEIFFIPETDWYFGDSYPHNIHAAWLVFSIAANCAPPTRAKVQAMFVRFAAKFMTIPVPFKDHGEEDDMVPLGVVGLESLLPGVDPLEFHNAAKLPAIAESVIGQDVQWSRDNLASMDQAYDNISFMSLQDWLEAQGHRKEIVGVWPTWT